MARYAVVFEAQGTPPRNFAAYVPDLPGCVATGATRADVERNIKEAITFHIDGLRLDHQPVPPPSSWTGLVELSTP